MYKIFEKEKEELKTIINTKTILQNIDYKLRNDKNVKLFMENLVENIKTYDDKDMNKTDERMHNYYFKKDFEEMFELLLLYKYSFETVSTLKKYKGEDIAKCCNVFPDYIGEHIIRMFAYLPLMELFNKKIKYEDYINEKKDLNKKIFNQTPKEYQLERLFGENILNKRNIFKKAEDFIDYELKNKYIEKVEEKYEKEIKKDLKNNLDFFINKLSRDNTEKEIKQQEIYIGIAYWNESFATDDKMIESFKKVLNSIVGNLEKEKKKKYEFVEKVLKGIIKNNDKIKKYLINDLIDLKINKDEKLIITLSYKEENLELEKIIKEIEEIYIITTKVEVTDIKYIDKTILLSSQKDDKKIELIFKLNIE